MMKLKRYLKPYIGFALAAIVLMFCQAAVDLNLPNLMSDIVNVGIQQGGITEAAPKAVSAEGLQLMSAFMSEEDRALAQSQYVLAEQANMTADEWDRFVTDSESGRQHASSTGQRVQPCVLCADDRC